MDRLPPAALNAASTPEAQPSAWSGTLFAEESGEASLSRRGSIQLVPNAPDVEWINRAALDGRGSWTISQQIELLVSGRLNLDAGPAPPIYTGDQFRADIRELYLKLHPASAVSIDLGRVNDRGGTAFFFSPTDIFKTESAPDEFTIDPGALRDARLGAYMVRGQWLLSRGAVSIAFAPKLAGPTLATETPSGIDLGFSHTNSDDRLLIKGSWRLAPDFAPELDMIHDRFGWRIGANLTRGIRDSVILYAEWTGGRRPSLAGRAYLDAVKAGAAPPGSPPAALGQNVREFENAVAVGGTYTTSSHLFLTIEYDYNQAAFRPKDWAQWFDLAAGGPGNLGPLWYLRGYAQAEQEPLSRHRVDTRVEWDGAGALKPELSALAIVDLEDGSILGQAELDLDLDAHWKAGATVQFGLGSTRSEYGSIPGSAGLLLKIARSF